MGNIKYNSDDYRDINKQHNIMCLIGNGFDIGILSLYQRPVNTSYENFYYFLKYRNCPKDNLIYKKMREEKNIGNISWSDFELSLITLINDNVDFDKLEKDLHHIQIYFSMFLNDIVSPSLLDRIGRDSEKNKLAQNSLSYFTQDLSEQDYYNFIFSRNLNHYDLYNFTFFNFNYTTLFDNYIYLDKRQFDPHPYKNADRNFNFQINPNSYKTQQSKWSGSTFLSSYIMTKIIHPHGIQSLPKSMLFGFNDKEQISASANKEKANRFSKTFWGQNEIKYRRYFDDTELYIVFGLSLGITDKWWWNHITNSLLQNDSELIIYVFSPTLTDEKQIKMNFITNSGVTLSDTDLSHVLNKIYIVQYNNNISHKFLDLSI